mmetsp:Transcript_45347/g.135320  ORF Transcript_45347/g.135320 Transcript_45347/m.135320 type:complete len:109 (-) Transcript_45347:176-502(-)
MRAAGGQVDAGGRRTMHALHMVCMVHTVRAVRCLAAPRWVPLCAAGFAAPRAHAPVRAWTGWHSTSGSQIVSNEQVVLCCGALAAFGPSAAPCPRPLGAEDAALATGL